MGQLPNDALRTGEIWPVKGLEGKQEEGGCVDDSVKHELFPNHTASKIQSQKQERQNKVAEFNQRRGNERDDGTDNKERPIKNLIKSRES